MKKQEKQEMLFTTEQIIAAMEALGIYKGNNSEIEHKKEEKRLGGKDMYQIFLSNALLGVAESNAVIADSLSAERLLEFHNQALQSASANENNEKLLQFLCWRVLRVSVPLREMAQRSETGPIVLSAAHATEGLRLLLSVCADGQIPFKADPKHMLKNMLAAKDSLTYAIGNIDIMLNLINGLIR